MPIGWKIAFGSSSADRLRVQLRVDATFGELTERRLVRLWRGCQPPEGDQTLWALGKRPSFDPHFDSRRQLGDAPTGCWIFKPHLTRGAKR